MAEGYVHLMVADNRFIDETARELGKGFEVMGNRIAGFSYSSMAMRLIASKIETSDRNLQE